MSRTVSFRASEELDEYLEQEAERRLTTKSTVVQMIVAEHFQEVKGEQQEGGTEEEESTNPPEEEDSDTQEDSQEEEGKPAVFQKHGDKWYVPDSQKGYNYAVRCPDQTRYYKTQDGAENRLIEEYE